MLLSLNLDRYPNYQPTHFNNRYLFFTGKGGVGKTSIACATAIVLANFGKKVLIVSTDPASNLDDVFETKLGSVPIAIQGVLGLFGANLDPEQAAFAYREKVVGPYRGILPDSAIASIEEQLSGACTVEIAAFDEFTKLLAATDVSDGYDHIIFDTAPTGHTLRLLQLPQAWTTFLDTSPNGASCLGPLSGLGDKQDLYAKTVRTLSNADLTALILVVRPDKAALEEAARASHELSELGIFNQHLIINGVLTSQSEDTAAEVFRDRQRKALEEIPEVLNQLPKYSVSLRPYGLTGIKHLGQLLSDNQPNLAEMMLSSESSAIKFGIKPLLDSFIELKKGVILTMGKGGVGKTTIAAAIAVGLAEQGHKVHLTTTDPAAHLAFALGDSELSSNLTISRIDPKVETVNYINEVLQRSRGDLDNEGMDLLKEDLASPCTEEIAVFRAFARVVDLADDEFVVLDTAPTGHTLLLLDAAEAYHKEVQRSSGDIPDYVRKLLPRLRNPNETHVVLVTLPEATPVFEAERLQNDLIRAGIKPEWWVINQSWQQVYTEDDILKQRSLGEKEWIQKAGQLAQKFAIVQWQLKEPIGIENLLNLI